MSLENANYINQLIQTNPDGTDPKGQGDDHIRLIKKVLKDTFPSFTGSLSGTQDQYNSLLQEGITAKPGMIVMFSGPLSSIPGGWLLCNGSGSLSNGWTVPDLRDRFVAGAGGSYAVGTIAGSANHTHTATNAETILTIDQIPSHTHGNQIWRSNGANSHSVPGMATDLDAEVTVRTGATGGGRGHTHSSFVSTSSNLPPFYALAFIIKT